MSDAKDSNTTSPTVSKPTRREFIHLTAGAMGAVGLGAAAWPFINSMNPSADVMALSSVEIDISGIQKGQTHTVMWRGRPVFVRHRTEEEIKEMRATPLKQLPDPETDEHRTKDPNWLVVVGVCTHLGASRHNEKPCKPLRTKKPVGFVLAMGQNMIIPDAFSAAPPPETLKFPFMNLSTPTPFFESVSGAT